MGKRTWALVLALTLSGTLAGCGEAEDGGGGGGDMIQEDEGAIEQRPDMQNRGMDQDDRDENEGTERRGTGTND